MLRNSSAFSCFRRSVDDTFFFFLLAAGGSIESGLWNALGVLLSTAISTSSCFISSKKAETISISADPSDASTLRLCSSSMSALSSSNSGSLCSSLSAKAVSIRGDSFSAERILANRNVDEDRAEPHCSNQLHVSCGNRHLDCDHDGRRMFVLRGFEKRVRLWHSVKSVHVA